MGNERKKTIQIIKTPLLVSYLEALVKRERYGGNPTEVAKYLIWRGIDEFIENGTILRLPEDRPN